MRLYDAPHNWMVDKKVKTIGGMFRNIIEVSFHEKNAAYVRARILVPLYNPLLSGWWFRRAKMDPVWIEFRYENLPFFCFYCGRISHDESQCSLHRKDMETKVEVCDQFGTWIRADRFIRTHDIVKA